jgi:hypothetical protein
MTMQLLAILHVALGAWFTALWSRSVGTGWVPAVVAGVTFSLSGLLCGIYWPCWLETMAWVPLCMDSIERYVQRGQLRGLPLLSLSIAMLFLAGGYQASVYALMGAAAYAGFASLSPPSWRDKLRVALALLFAAGLGLALAAPQLLTTYELAQLTDRSTQALTPARRFPFGVLSLSFRDMVAGFVVAPDRVVAGYFGAVPLALALVGLLSARRVVVAWACVMAVWASLNVMLPPWFAEALGHIPVVSWFRLPQRSSLLLYAAVGIFAALGTQTVLSTPLAERRRAAIAGGTLLLACAAFAWLRFPGELWWVPLTLAGVVALAKVLDRPTPLAAAIVLLTIYDLTGTTRNDLVLPWMKEARTQVSTRISLLGAVAEHVGLDRVLPVGTQFNSRVWSPKLASLSGVSTPIDYEPLTPRASGDYLSFAARGEVLSSESFLPFTGVLGPEDELKLVTQGRPYLSAMNVRYYLLAENATPDVVQQIIASGLTVVDDAQGKWPGLTLLEDSAALPRAYGVYGVECAADANDALARIGSVNLRSSALLEGDCTAQSPQDGAAAAEVRIESYAPTRVEIRATLAVPGHVVLADAFHPGWRASVDGEPVAIRRTNALARAVVVPAGEHRVVFTYRPLSFTIGLCAAGVALALLALISLRGMRADSGWPRLSLP